MTSILIICILLATNLHTLSGFCDDKVDYACTRDGITQCQPKTERCQDDSDCMKPLPIEKPPCKQECQEEHTYWCEERGQCISNREHCDCGPGKVYCNSEGTYSCENRRGIATSSIFGMCRDGTCSSDCAVSDASGSCKEGQFGCGGGCKNVSAVTVYRDCMGDCIKAEDFCYLHPSPSTSSASDETSKGSSGVIGAVVAIIVALFLVLLAVFIYMKRETLKTLYTQSRRNIGSRDAVHNGGYEMDKDTEHENPPEVWCPPPESLESRIERHQQIYTWLLVEEKQGKKRYYCRDCIQAGLDNEFTKDRGADPTDQNVKSHLKDSYTYTLSSHTSMEDPMTEMESSQKKITSKDSHQYGIKIMDEVKLFSKNVLNSGQTFSLILYEQNNVLALILKALMSLEIEDIYFPLGMIEMDESIPTVSILEKIRQFLASWEIELNQISSISAVNIEGRLPSKSIDVCNSFCSINECISIHNISHESPLEVQQEKIESSLQDILEKVLFSLTFVLNQSRNGFRILSNFQKENNEPITEEEMFQEIRIKPMKDIINFITACPKSIEATLIKIRDEMVDSNKTDEDKERIDGLIDFMNRFTTKATLLLHKQVNEIFSRVYAVHENPNFDWNMNIVEEEMKYLKTSLEKINKDVLTTRSADNNLLQIYMDKAECLQVNKIGSEKTKTTYNLHQTSLVNNHKQNMAKQSLKKLLNESQHNSDVTPSELNLFRKHQEQVIQRALEDLQSSFPVQSMPLLHYMSKAFDPKNTKPILHYMSKAFDPKNTKLFKDKHMEALQEKFSQMKYKMEKFKHIEEIKANFTQLDIKQFARLLVRDYSDSFPNFTYMAEIFLNINTNTEDLKELLMEIDAVKQMSSTKLNLQEKNTRVHVKTVRKPMDKREEQD